MSFACYGRGFGSSGSPSLERADVACGAVAERETLEGQRTDPLVLEKMNGEEATNGWGRGHRPRSSTTGAGEADDVPMRATRTERTREAAIVKRM